MVILWPVSLVIAVFMSHRFAPMTARSAQGFLRKAFTSIAVFDVAIIQAVIIAPILLVRVLKNPSKIFKLMNPSLWKIYLENVSSSLVDAHAKDTKYPLFAVGIVAPLLEELITDSGSTKSGVG